VPRRSEYPIELNDAERVELERTARRYSAPYREVVRAKIVLLAADGIENKEIASRVDLPVQIVYKWRKRFVEERQAGLCDRPRR
jgi:transposase-like protein